MYSADVIPIFTASPPLVIARFIRAIHPVLRHTPKQAGLWITRMRG